jgi:hypothetical protein
MAPLLQLARLALIVAAPGRDGGLRGQVARRRRRGPEGLSLDPRVSRTTRGA